jgi:hypothetical protein
MKIFGPTREEVAVGWRRPYNEELHNLYASSDIITVMKSRRMRQAGHVARMGEMRNAYNILAGRSEGKKPIRRSKHRWEDNIRMYLREMGWEGVDWMHLAQDREHWRALVNTVMAGKFLNPIADKVHEHYKYYTAHRRDYIPQTFKYVYLTQTCSKSSRL